MPLAAAALLFLTGVAHSYLGERYILIRLFQIEGVGLAILLLTVFGKQ